VIELQADVSTLLDLLGGKFRSMRHYADDRLMYFIASDVAFKAGKSGYPGGRLRSLLEPSNRDRTLALAGGGLTHLVVVLGSSGSHEHEFHRRFEDEAIANEWYPRASTAGWFFEQLLAHATEA